MQTAALVIICAFALWIAAGSVAAIARAATARGWIGRFATSHAINIAEQAWRGIAGGALVLRAPLSLAPGICTVAGWIMVVSAAALLVIPLRWHAAYATYWSRYLPLGVVRIGGLAGLGLAAWFAVAATG